MPALRIAIAGAGTAGLAAAAFLTRDGHDVRLFERFAEPRPLGAGLMLQPTGLACLARLGLDRAAIDHGAIVLGIDGKTVRGAHIFNVHYRELGAAPVRHRHPSRRAVRPALRRGQAAPPYRSTPRSRWAPAAACQPAASLIDAQGNEHGPFDLVVDGTGQRSPLRAGEVQVNVDRPYPYGALWGITHDAGQLAAPGLPGAGLRRLPPDGRHPAVGRRPGDPRRLAALFWSLRVRDHAAWREAGIERWRAQVLKAWPAARPFVERSALSTTSRSPPTPTSPCASATPSASSSSATPAA